jgi:hypothetical protein
MDTDWDGACAAAPVTSSHVYDGGIGTAWGHGASNSGPGTTGFALSCVNCHDPHGGAGTGGAATYRLLRSIPTGSGAATGVNVPDEDPKAYVVSDEDNRYFGELYGAQQDPLSEWCTLCHTRYEALTGSAASDSGDSIFKYQHTTSGPVTCIPCHDVHFILTPPNPLDISYQTAHAPRCETCHVAHGTSAGMGELSGDVEWPDASETPSGDSRSSLLRLDSRTTCYACHAR